MATAELDTTPVVEQPIRSDASIPRANILPARRDFPEDDWLTIADVPVFAEHETETTKGRELKFDVQRLKLLAANCNRRISETGDYAGVIVGHTPDPGQGHHNSPMPLVGLAGPFRVGLISQPGQKPRWAVLADFHLHRDKADVIRDFPRRSAELWVEEEYEDMYLDPIALLGAEAPRLDMGLLYSARRRDGVEVEKYSVCAPSATSVFVPSDGDDREDYSAESAAADPPDNPNPENERPAMALSPEELQQITEAISQQPWAIWAQEQMAASDEPDVPDEPVEEPPVDEPPVDGPLDEPAAPPVDEPAVPDTPAPPVPEDEEVLPVKYSRLHGQVAELRNELKTVRGQLHVEQGKRINTERYAALAERRRTHLFDLDAEFERVKYGRVSDEQFAAHLEVIDANYREIPLDMIVPTFDDAAAMSRARPGAAANRERYSKEASDKAMRICKAKLKAGERVSYEEVLEQVVSGEE